MLCKFCKSETENIHVSTGQCYCSDDCLDSQLTYSKWKTKNHDFLSTPIYKEEEEEEEGVSVESFHDIIVRTGGYPVHCAHRGGGFSFGPENTLYSFKKSVAHGVRVLELDLRLTKDLELVLMHWSTVDETTDGHGPIANYTLAELKKLDAAVQHEELKGTGIRVPTFKEFLDEMVPVKDLLFFFDFKDALTLRMALKFIAPYHIEGRYALGSVLSATNSLIRRRRNSPAVPVCTDIIQTFKITLAHFFNLLDLYHFEHDVYGFVVCVATTPFWTKALIEAIHGHGRRVTVSGYGQELNKPERLKQCIEYGVDFIMTDRPDLLQPLLDEMKQQQAEK